MSDYSIALSGLAAAQRAFDVIGNNIANAATEGYHRQRLELSPAFSLLPLLVTDHFGGQAPQLAGLESAMGVGSVWVSWRATDRAECSCNDG